MTLVVNGQKIDDKLVQQEIENLRPHHERAFQTLDPAERDTQLRQWSTENVIERVLLNQHATKHGEKITTAQIQKAFNEIKEKYGDRQLHDSFGTDNESQIKERIELNIKVERLLQRLYKSLAQPAPEDISEYYEQSKDRFKSPEKIRVAHIVKHINWQTDEKTAHDIILKAINELKKSTDFETVVAKYSDCPDNGGDLGYIEKGQMVEEFEDVVFNLGLNQLSGVFRTRFGFHIAKLYDRKPQTVQTLDQAKDYITRELKDQMQRNVLYQLVDRLKAEAKIEEI
ncbi:MAG: peptidylprolyl isomerase [Planctomycetota bacterium]|jgi:parvulin-like peptidyl-prolyl isomerase